MNSIQRGNRGLRLDRASELSEKVSALRGLPRERLPVEPSAQPQSRFQDRFQDRFDAASQRSKDGIDAAGKQRPEGRGFLENLLTSKEFQEKLQETLAGTSARAQQVKQVENTYKSFWKDSQDFSVSKGPSLTVPEPPRYVAPSETAWKGRGLTVPEFKLPVGATQEAARVQQASAALQEARRAVAVAEQPFTLLGRAAVRG